MRLRGTGKCTKRLVRRVKPWTTWTHQTSPGCGNLVLAPSHTTVGETSVRAPRTVSERANSIGICLANLTLNLGQAPIRQHFYLHKFSFTVRIIIFSCLILSSYLVPCLTMSSSTSFALPHGSPVFPMVYFQFFLLQWIFQFLNVFFVMKELPKNASILLLNFCVLSSLQNFPRGAWPYPLFSYWI